MTDLLASRFLASIGPTRATVQLAVHADDGAIAYLSFRDDDTDLRRYAARNGHSVREDADACRELADQTRAFLAGDSKQFELADRGDGTPFQRSVWRALQSIPYGATISYRDLAEQIGKPTAFRAVARANATNPISLAVPCHRVIGSDGTLTGYGGGLEVKRALLHLERHTESVGASDPG